MNLNSRRIQPDDPAPSSLITTTPNHNFLQQVPTWRHHPNLKDLELECEFDFGIAEHEHDMSTNMP